MINKKDYLLTAVGNPDGDDKPNKKFFDVSVPPRPQQGMGRLGSLFGELWNAFV